MSKILPMYNINYPILILRSANLPILFLARFVGVGARRVRSLFQAAKKKVPCLFLLFIVVIEYH